MNIDFEREGGYAPLRLKYRANTEELPRDVAEKILDLIDRSGILELKQEDIQSPAKYPDVFSYRITLSEDGGGKSLTFNDITAPDSLRPLLTFLQELALEKLRSGNR